MDVFGRAGVFWASMRAWRFVPEPDMRTASRRRLGRAGSGVVGGDADMVSL